MVHGSTGSIGCYAMTDPLIEEIYLLVDAALKCGQDAISVHSFPFRMNAQRMEQAATTRDELRWLDEWRNLKEGYDWFQRTHLLPKVTTEPRGHYIFE